VVAHSTSSRCVEAVFDASPALVDDELYLRGNRYLYSIATR
jgi:hypothetical protein